MISRAPFVGFVLSYSLGLLAAEWLPASLQSQFYNILAILLCFILAIAAYSYRFLVSTGLCLLLSILFLGLLIMQRDNWNYYRAITDPHFLQVKSYVALIEGLPQKRSNSLHLPARIVRVNSGGHWHKVNVRLLLMIPPSVENIPSPGMHLMVIGEPQIPPAPLNPYQFDYRRFLRDKSIFRTDFIQEEDYKILPTTGVWLPLRAALSVSEAADAIFRKAIADDKGYALVKAMLLGRRDDLRGGQVDDFAVSGAVHILSVSGLHVGILYLVFAALLGWLKKWRWGKLVYLTIMLLILAFYALLTGLPDSVVRATIMFSVILLAQTYQRQSVSINTLAISALIILILEPRAIYHVGFQLSYAAMTGIFLLYKSIKYLWSPKARFTRFLWEVTCLSLSAQLATFPLAVYYFHQFPVYFWLVNPLILILAEFLIQSALALLIFQSMGLEWLANVSAFWLQWSAYLSNLAVTIPRLLPGHLLRDLYLDIIEVSLAYLSLIFVWVALRSAQLKFLYFSLFSLLGWALYSGAISTTRYFSKSAIIFSIPHANVIAWKYGRELRLSVVEDEKFRKGAYLPIVKTYAIASGATRLVIIDDTLSRPELRRLKNGLILDCNGVILYHGPMVSDWNGVNKAYITGPLPVTMPDLSQESTQFILGGLLSPYKQQRIILESRPSHYYSLSSGSLYF
ncbi:ComEC/Rec2 family competence protein [Dyadobacter tibetensis]|uniref:ComEC/Rec2 family competence protein n=1 Tax=Dyadobacter tibetensis TaxID=1211851 RepID=UPI0004708386|nr:ComEC/Rec2 family competence protein [Dyadobacter tibetensis]